MATAPSTSQEELCSIIASESLPSYVPRDTQYFDDEPISKAPSGEPLTEEQINKHTIEDQERIRDIYYKEKYLKKEKLTKHNKLMKSEAEIMRKTIDKQYEKYMKDTTSPELPNYSNISNSNCSIISSDYSVVNDFDSDDNTKDISGIVSNEYVKVNLTNDNMTDIMLYLDKHTKINEIIISKINPINRDYIMDCLKKRNAIVLALFNL